MKIAKKKMTFALSIFFVALFAVGYRTMTYLIGLRDMAPDQTTRVCGVPIASADVPVPPGGGEGGGGEGGCEGEGEGEGGCEGAG